MLFGQTGMITLHPSVAHHLHWLVMGAHRTLIASSTNLLLHTPCTSRFARLGAVKIFILHLPLVTCLSSVMILSIFKLQDLAVRTPWGLISAQYPTYFTGRRRLQGGTKGCKGGGGGDLLKRAARRLMQDSPGNEPTVLLLDGNAGAPPNGAGAAGLTLPENSTIGADYDANQVALGEWCFLHC